MLHRKVFSVVYVRTIRNFDLLGFMKEVVFRAGKPQSVQAKCADDFRIFWKSILFREIYDNLGADERHGVPETYEDDPCGALGVETVLHHMQVLWILCLGDTLGRALMCSMSFLILCVWMLASRLT